MLAWCLRLRHRLFPQPETSRLIVGSTGSGKSLGELVELGRLADRRDHAVVLLDGHGPLAFDAAGHWALRGHEPRMVYEPLHDTERVLCWDMLPRSRAASPSRRHLENAENRDDVAQCFLAQRNLATLNDRPLTKDWLEAAIALCLAQPEAEPLSALLDAFRVGSAEYERLLTRCERPEVVEKFRGAERLKRRSEVKYEVETGAARRLLELVCASEVVRLRCRSGPFDWLSALRERRLIAIDGGGLRSAEIKRTVFLLVSMQVIHAVRRHFAEERCPLPVVLVLEEAGALSLVTPFVLGAMQELRKAGLSVHLITQSSLDFGDRALFEALLANAPWQAWYQSLAPADQELGAKVMANPTFDAHSVHFTRVRAIPERARRVGQAVLTRYRALTDRYYKTPALHEQEYRTLLATLRVGERLVRDRRGVRCECVRLLRPPWRLRATFDDVTRAAIDRVRREPLYLDCAESPQGAVPLPDAAARLGQRALVLAPPSPAASSTSAGGGT